MANPYCALHYDTMAEALASFEFLNDLVEDMSLNLSVYRISFGGESYVVLVGEEDDLGYFKGNAEIPDGVIDSLCARRQEKKPEGDGAVVEHHPEGIRIEWTNG